MDGDEHGEEAGRRGYTVAHLVYELARRSPRRTAVIDRGLEATYGNLIARSEALRGCLRELIDARRGGDPCVALLVPRGVDFVAAALAVMAEGAAYLPVDPALPAARARFMVSDSAALAVIVGEGAVVPDQVSAPIVRTADHVTRRPSYPAAVLARRKGLAYITYTSGSQGIPKGVEIEHGALLNLARWHAGEYRVTPDDCALHTASLSFDAIAWELWPYLCRGASVAVAQDDIRTIPERLLAYSPGRPVSLVFLPTPIAEEVVALGGSPPWRALLTGGDRLRVNRGPEHYGLVNHYGPTEATVVTTRYRVPRELVTSCAPIGRPIAGVRVAVCDPDQREVAPGEVGEIVIGGAGIARGYRGRPALTAERFVPLQGRDGRWYRSGDLGRHREDGELEFMGRIDGEQLKIRGMRVEATEIEAALIAHPRLRNAAVCTVGTGARTLVVALVVGVTEPPDARELRAHLRDRLPAGLIPNRMIGVRSLPLTASGKLDRAAVGKVAAELLDGHGRS